jgi:hypothetical protein
LAEVPKFLQPLRHVTAVVPAHTDGGASKPDNPLCVKLEKQALSEWCWAAVTCAIAAFYREPTAEDQCRVATRWLMTPCCPPGPDRPDNPLNIPYNVITALGSNAGAQFDAQISFEDLAHEVDQGRPICCVVDWSEGRSHVLIAAGYTGDRDLWIDDPALPGLRRYSWDLFKATYEGGVWRRTILTKKSND